MEFDGPEIGGAVAAQKSPTGRPAAAAAAPQGQQAGGAPKNDFTNPNNGPVISHAHVVLIFWGTAWASIPPPIPSAGEIIDAAVIMASGQYMDALGQYGVGRGSLLQATYVTSAVGQAPANPPNPFSDSDIHQVINELCNAGRVPSPANDSQLFYCVFTPNGVANTNSGFIGEHTFSTIAGVRAHWAWTTNGGTLASVTSVFSHELVEACTDPEGTGWTGTVCNQGGWCEIGDVCTGNNTTVDGVTVQRYWSNFDGQCVVPTDAVVKTDKDTKDSKDHKDKDKDTKDRKDRKDTKEKEKDAKEKDKDAKEKDQDRPADVTLDAIYAQVEELSSRVAALEGSTGTAASFIAPDERPEVGGGVTGA